MRALLAQLEPDPARIDANVAAVTSALAEHPDVSLAVFPELFLTGYDPARAAAHALTPDADAFARIMIAAARHGTAVMVGFAERTADGVANALACISADGGWAGTYRKTHLFGREERAAYVAGDVLEVIELAGCRVGPLICFDMEFPEPARALARAGCELLVTVAANMEPCGGDHELAARARALDNRLPHLYVNRTGRQVGLQFVGASAAIDSGGSPITVLGSGPELAVVEIDIGAEAPSTDLNYLDHVRDDLVVEPVPVTSAQGDIR